MSLMAMCKIGA